MLHDLNLFHAIESTAGSICDDPVYGSGRIHLHDDKQRRLGQLEFEARRWGAIRM